MCACVCTCAHACVCLYVSMRVCDDSLRTPKEGCWAGGLVVVRGCVLVCVCSSFGGGPARENFSRTSCTCCLCQSVNQKPNKKVRTSCYSLAFVASPIFCLLSSICICIACTYEGIYM